MQPPTDTDLALESLLRAEAELQDYARTGAHNPEQHKLLAENVQLAIDELIGLADVARPGS